VAVVGIGCAVALAMQFRPRRTPPADAAGAPPKHDPQAQVEGGRGESLQVNMEGKEQWKVGFSSMAGYADGRSKFTDAHFVSAQKTRELDIKSKKAETQQGKGPGSSGPSLIKLDGDVRIATSDRWLIQSDSATYVEATGILTIPGPLTFSRDRMTGQGQKGTYDRINGVLTIVDQAHITNTADETGAGALDAGASRMTIARPQKSAHLEGSARLERDKEILASDDQTLLFTDDEKGLKQLDMRGHASVVPKPGVTDGPPTMSADTIGLLVYPDGRTMQHATLRGKANVQLTSTTGAKTIAAPTVDLQLGKDGQTVTKLDANGGVTVQLPPTPDTPAARTIVAPTLVTNGNDKAGLQSALFSGGVTFTEHVAASGSTPASDRNATSKALALKLNGDLGAVDEAEFRQSVTFKDGDIRADAEHAVYAEARSSLKLDAGGTRSQPTVVNGTVKVWGDQVDVATDTHNVRATGAAQTKSTPATPANGAKPAAPGLFDGDQPVLGASQRLTYDSAAQRATYEGTDKELARVWQAEGNDVLARTIEVEQATNNLHATGRVDSHFTTDPKPASGRGGAAQASTVYHAKADELRYDDASRTARYTGSSAAAELTGPNGTTAAKQIDVLLASASRTVDKLVADGDVHLTSDSAREGRGDHLTYEAATDQYHLLGGPAQAVLPQAKADNTPPSCTLYRGKALTFAGNGSASATGDTVTSQGWTCGKPIPIR
jgi:hypothetical protein